MTYLITALTMAGLLLIGYGLLLTWPPLSFAAGGVVLLKVAWSLDDDGGAEGSATSSATDPRTAASPSKTFGVEVWT